MSKQPSSIMVPITIMVLLVTTLIGAMYLSRNNQNTQKGAYFSGAKLMVLPSQIETGVGSDVSVQLWVTSEMITGGTDPAKINSADVTFCYGDGLVLALPTGTTDPATVIDLNQTAFRVLVYTKNDTDSKCLRLTALSDGIPSENLSSGTVEVAAIRFKAVKAGTGTIALDMAKSKIGGYNPATDATDMAMKIGSVEDATYTINGSGTVMPTPNVVEGTFWGFIKKLLGF
jgi:hypothetical protein